MISKRNSTNPLEKEEIYFTRRSNAKRYIARVDSEGKIVVTIPRGGNQRSALAFAQNHGEWLFEQRKAALAILQSHALASGDFIWFRGLRVRLKVSKHWGRPVLSFADQKFYIADEGMSLARPLADHFRQLAAEEFPMKALKLAKKIGVRFKRITIRDQKTRWGSCSYSGVISLNWRIVMAPREVEEYIIMHELLHLKELNHSPAFWKLVEKACPNYLECEQWLDSHQTEISWGA